MSSFIFRIYKYNKYNEKMKLLQENDTIEQFN